MWSIFFLIITDIVLAAILFFVLLAVALLGDYNIVQLIAYFKIDEDPVIFYVRKGGKYFIIAVDCVIVASFIIKGLFKTWKEIWRSK